jgi:hypothetical protein
MVGTLGSGAARGGIGHARARWADFHMLRTFLSLAGLAAVVGMARTTRPSRET